MRDRKTYAERIAELQAKRDRLREQEKSLLARQLSDEKKARTKRIFKAGTMIEETYGHTITERELDELVEKIKEWHKEKQVVDNESPNGDDDYDNEDQLNKESPTEYGAQKLFGQRFQH